MSAFSGFHELQATTAVTGATHASLLSPTARNLVCARGSTLEVYEVAPHSNSTSQVFTHGKWLKLVGSFALYGTILSVRSIRPNQAIAMRYVMGT